MRKAIVTGRAVFAVLGCGGHTPSKRRHRRLHRGRKKRVAIIDFDYATVHSDMSQRSLARTST